MGDPRYKRELHTAWIARARARIWRGERGWTLREHKGTEENTRICRWFRKGVAVSMHAACEQRKHMLGRLKNSFGYRQKRAFPAAYILVFRLAAMIASRFIVPRQKPTVYSSALLWERASERARVERFSRQECGASVRTLKALVATPLSLSLTPRRVSGPFSPSSPRA